MGWKGLLVQLPSKSVLGIFHFKSVSAGISGQPESRNIVIPSTLLIQEFNKQVEKIDNSISLCEMENEKLTELQSLLLAKMGQ